MKINELIQQIENTYSKHFPASKCFVNYTTNLYHSIFITCNIAANKTEVSNGIWENDILKVRFSIDTDKGQFEKGLTLESEVPENLRLEVNDKRYFIKPESKHMAYDCKTLSFRKTKGNAKKIVATLDKYFAKLKSELKSDLLAGNITDNYVNLLTEKLA